MKEWDAHMMNIRTVYASEEFMEFYRGLDEKVQEKFRQGLQIIQSQYVLNTRWVKKLVNTDLYEMRVSVGYNEYRTILFAVDNSNIILSTRIILLNGFLKKSTKDYEKQIKKAHKIIKGLEHEEVR